MIMTSSMDLPFIRQVHGCYVHSVLSLLRCGVIFQYLQDRYDWLLILIEDILLKEVQQYMASDRVML